MAIVLINYPSYRLLQGNQKKEKKLFETQTIIIIKWLTTVTTRSRIQNITTKYFDSRSKLINCETFILNFIVIENRFPLMESNMEARIGNTNSNISNSNNKINDTNYFHGGRYSIYTTNGNNTVLVRPNASLPRKLHTGINRNAYYGYSHGK